MVLESQNPSIDKFNEVQKLKCTFFEALYVRHVRSGFMQVVGSIPTERILIIYRGMTKPIFLRASPVGIESWRSNNPRPTITRSLL